MEDSDVTALLWVGVGSSRSAGRGDTACSESAAGVEGAVKGLTTGDRPGGNGVEGLDLVAAKAVEIC